MQDCISCKCMELVKARRKQWIPWSRSYRWLWATVWVLRRACVSSGRAACAFTLIFISLAPRPQFCYILACSLCLFSVFAFQKPGSSLSETPVIMTLSSLMIQRTNSDQCNVSGDWSPAGGSSGAIRQSGFILGRSLLSADCWEHLWTVV